MKRVIAAARPSRKKAKVDYLDPKTQFNDATFRDNEMFHAIGEFLYKNNIPADDLKAHISGREYYGDDEFEVNCKFKWIFYPEDVSKADFKKVAKNIEKLFKAQFKADDWFEVDCVRYDDSEYTEHGYDVELTLTIHYGLIPDEDINSSTDINAALDPAVNKALNTARSDARKAMQRWHQSKDLGIDTILHSMGYETSSRLSSYEMYRSVVSYSSGYNKLYAVINYYNLIIGKEHNMTVYVTDSIMDGENLSGTKVVKDNYYA